MALFPSFDLLLWVMLVSASSQSQWTSGQYPDLRGPTVSQCAAVLPRNRQHMYICDPDRILNNSQAMSLNRQLRDLAVGTPCHCQRRSQCTTGISGTGTEGFHGFVVSVAIVQNLQMQVHSPSEAQLTERAESFCRALEGRWALGDCGNSMIIWPARLAEKYVTVEERKHILSKVNELIQADQWYLALSQVIAELLRELNGEEQGKVDTGTLSLLVAVGLAVLLTLLITCRSSLISGF
uniref:Protein tweety homolog n=1 Tax=Angiostrongylus cantonensis TaxID=6313 RepID=A0A0K0CWQ3_ANGCA